mmetsp:Transcript_12325/g.30934  ORF Transcript_12325/g.30934 Transcript_12325/m.30934 type:complete len:122 (-) Transcript_12325:46-411(-)
MLRVPPPPDTPFLLLGRGVGSRSIGRSRGGLPLQPGISMGDMQSLISGFDRRCSLPSLPKIRKLRPSTPAASPPSVKAAQGARGGRSLSFEAATWSLELRSECEDGPSWQEARPLRTPISL